MSEIIHAYTVYKEKLHQGHHKEVAERLSSLPDKDFGIMYTQVMCTELPPTNNRRDSVKELISSLEDS